MTEEEIKNTYDLIKDYHKKFLEDLGVSLPDLKKNGKYVKDALALVYLAQGYPNTRPVSKNELTIFMRRFYPETTDVQQARHLANIRGWFILSGTRHDVASIELDDGYYQLKTLEEPYDKFNPERRKEFLNGDEWESMKKKYEYRCACCGSKEGEPHRYWKNTITKLQKGHMDPRKPLEPDNIIPQCEKCNRPDRNYWVYDEYGRVTNIASATIIDKCSDELKEEIFEKLKHDLGK